MLEAVTVAGFQERQRKLRALLFLRARVLAAASSEAGRQASVFLVLDGSFLIGLVTNELDHIPRNHSCKSRRYPYLCIL